MNSIFHKDLNDLLVDLEFAIDLPANRHLNTITRRYDRKWLLSGILRYMTDDDRDKAKDFLNAKIDESILMCEKYPEWTDHICQKVQGLAGTCDRLINFYGDTSDPIICGHLKNIKLRCDPDKFKNSLNINKNINIKNDETSSIKNYSTPSGTPTEQVNKKK